MHCKICNEPWEVYGLKHGVVKAWEADMILSGYGCPCCEDNTFKVSKNYIKPDPIIIFNCNCCQKDITVDCDEIEYHGGNKIIFEKPILYETNDGRICEECFDLYYFKCDKCEDYIHEDSINTENGNNICHMCREISNG